MKKSLNKRLTQILNDQYMEETETEPCDLRSWEKICTGMKPKAPYK